MGLLVIGRDWLCLMGPKCGISTSHPTQADERNRVRFSNVMLNSNTLIATFQLLFHSVQNICCQLKWLFLKCKYFPLLRDVLSCCSVLLSRGWQTKLPCSLHRSKPCVCAVRKCACYAFIAMAVVWLGYAIQPCNTLKDFNRVMGKCIWSASVLVKIHMGCGSCQGQRIHVPFYSVWCRRH